MGNLAGKRTDLSTRQEENISWSDSFGLGSGESLRTGQSPNGMGLCDTLQLSQEEFVGAMRVFRAPGAGSV